MKCLDRNKTQYSICFFERKAEILDAFGNSTGEYRLVYSSPITRKDNISVERGKDTMHLFGIESDYDRVIIIDNMDLPIDENSILFIGVTPEKNTRGVYNYNYRVFKVATSLNYKIVAIKRV